MMNVDKLFHLLMGCHTGGLSNLLNEYPKGCSTDFEGDVKRLFDSYSELASSGYLEVGKDILASGITVEVGDRIESSYGRMIAQISYEVLDAIFQEAAKRPIGICQFEPYLDLQDWKGLSKLSQAEIQAIAKRQALIDSTKLEGLMRRMLVEFENVENNKPAKIEPASPPRIVVTKKELLNLLSKKGLHRGRNAIAGLIKNGLYGLQNEPPSNACSKTVSLFQSDFDRISSLKSPV